MWRPITRRTALISGGLGGLVAAVGRRLSFAQEVVNTAALPHCAFGAHALPHDGQANQQESTLALETLIGRKLGIFRRYSYWDQPPPDNTHLWAAKGGRTPYISWHAYTRDHTPIPWASIARGDQDAYIKTVGKGLATCGYPLFFNFHHEPENDPGNGTPAEFKAAFERVRKLFDSEGATNLTWMVTLMGTTYRGNNGGADLWLPAPTSYHYVGTDGYNRWPLIPKPPWRSFTEVFGAAHDKAVLLNKPLFIGEYGCVESTDPDAKGNWFLDMAQVIQTWGNVAGISYSNADPLFAGKVLPYWVDTSPYSLASFKAVGLSPYFAYP